jgi:methylphosphotriester-DNA--protein-cysteine methyltransferase
MLHHFPAEAVGVTPKQFFRIQRFNEATRQLASSQHATLADLAAAAARPR